MNKKYFGKNLKYWMNYYQIKQIDLAMGSKINQPILSKIIAGKAYPNLETTIRIIKYFNKRLNQDLEFPFELKDFVERR